MARTKKPPKRASRGPQIEYAERWAAMDMADKTRLVGDRVEEFNCLEDVEEEKKTLLATEAETRLRIVVGRLTQSETHTENLRTERNQLMIELALLGMKQTDIARACGVSNVVVSRTLGVIERKP